MGFADTVAGRLFCARRKSDLEFQIQLIMERKMAVLDECNEISAMLATTIFQDGLHSSITTPAATPGFLPSSPVDPPVGISQVAIGQNTYEQVLAELQGIEKQLDTEQKKKEVELEAVKAEEESMKKMADDHAKKDFKVGS